MSHIPLEECEGRAIYRLQSRNLIVGVFNEKKNGFIGIRQKFDSRYLFTEYHFDNGPPLGTARPLERLGKLDNEHIRLWESYPGSMCEFCGRPVEYRKELYERYQVDRETWPWVHTEAVDDCGEAGPIGYGTYRPLFNILEDHEDELGET